MKTFICKNVDYYLYFLKVNILQFNNSGILGIFDVLIHVPKVLLE